MYKDHEKVTIGGTPGTSSRHPTVPRTQVGNHYVRDSKQKIKVKTLVLFSMYKNEANVIINIAIFLLSY